MQIELSRKEYGDLIDVLMIADAVVNTEGGVEDKRKRPFDQVIQKLLAQAQTFGFADIIAYNEQLRRFSPTTDYEKRSDARPLLEEYESARFLERLAIALGIRDYEEIPTRERPLAALERLEQQEELSDVYREDFERHGLKNLRLFKE